MAALAATALLAPSSIVSGTDAPGNNGTVKIHEGATETEPIVHNEPHVCTFHLHFFFADPFQAGSWEIQEWAPGDAKGQVVLSGTYDTNSDGEDRQPEQGAYSLPDGHYKLFWDGDTDKHDKMKVFWVDCAAASEAPSFESSGSPATEAPSFESSGSPATEAPSFESSGSPATEVPSFESSGSPATEVPSFESSGSPATEVPSETPTFSEVGAGATNVPGGNVNGGPPTLPNTATASSPAAAPDDHGWRFAVLGLAAILGVLLVLPQAHPVRERR